MSWNRLRQTATEWSRADPGNFLLAALLLVGLVAAAVLAALVWNPWLLAAALIVFPVWALLRRGGGV